MRRLRKLWPLPAMFGMLFLLAVLVSFRSASSQSIGVGLNIREAVVDIGPTTNNGPGDQTKGILNWSASPIILIPAPGFSKFIQVLSWSYQYKPGAAAYVDPNNQAIGLLIGTPASGSYGISFTASNLQLTTLNSFLAASLSLNSLPFIPLSATSSINNGTATQYSDNMPIVFADSAAVGELTTGDGSVRIMVQYTIEKIL